VTIRLLEALATVAARVRRPADLGMLRQHALMLERGAGETIPEKLDRARITARFETVMAHLDSSVATGQPEAVLGDHPSISGAFELRF
jgi:hypothetical protein